MYSVSFAHLFGHRGMTFSEPVFLFLFLPFFAMSYLAAGPVLRNGLLLTASLLFYAWGEEIYVLVLLGSIALNYVAGLAIEATEGAGRRWALVLGVAANLALLGYFKYFGFLLESIGASETALYAPPLPVGISFFTFQALSYLVDLYRGQIAVQRSPFRLALYISMFPQLIAGPIVRYAEVEASLIGRRISRDDVSEGLSRFVTGLAKKTLIADPLGLVADQVYAVPLDGLSPGLAWLGAVSYALQLFFDFSAYSDMAIGLGRVLGFRFPENFDYPYVARSVTEFWRRWHMTLSRWFRDYVYIPLGGNRAGAGRTYLNLWVVFLLTGLWHGAAWTFVFWGAYHGVFLILERLGLGRLLARAPAVLGHAYLLVVVILGWVPFRAEGFDQALAFFRAMLGGQSGAAADFYPVARFLDAYVMLVMIAGVLFSTPFAGWLRRRIILSGLVAQVMPLMLFWLLFLVSLISVGAASYSPFIYFRF